MVAKRFERFEYGFEVEVGAHGIRRPVFHDGAVRQVEEPHAGFGCGRSLRQRSGSRYHRIEEGQAYAVAEATQHRSARNMLFGKEHGSTPFAGWSGYSLSDLFNDSLKDKASPAADASAGNDFIRKASLAMMPCTKAAKR